MTQKPVFIEAIFTLRNLRSMGAAALVEMLLAAGVAGILIWHQLQPVEQPQTPPGRIIEEPLPQTPPLQRSMPTTQPPDRRPWAEVPPIPTDVPSPDVQPLQPPQLPMTAGQTQPPQAVMDRFAASMLQAINRQKLYPKAEMLQGHAGEAVVSFDYVDGVVSNLRVDKSTGFGVLDQAAIEAVKKAVLPAKPAELSGLTHFVFELTFDLGR
ncbi:MAG TPA: TonB family protein [Gammaproteobacteria bacterium]|nr:TonB family protein [Gammaproteobacteria bacterium]